MAVGILPSKPALKISIDEVKTQERAGIKQSSGDRKVDRGTGGWATMEQSADGRTSGLDPELMIQEPLGAGSNGNPTIARIQKWPDEVNELMREGNVCTGRTLVARGTKTPKAATIRRPWLVEPERTIVGPILVGFCQ
jgi:hypothetical protein